MNNDVENNAAGEQTEIIAPPKIRRWPRIVLWLALFVAGMLCGAGLTVLHVMHVIRQGMAHPHDRTEHIMDRMTQQLDLTADQQKRIRDILTAQGRDLAAIHKDTMSKVKERLQRAEREIGEVLTPAQLEKWRALMNDMRQRWQPPGPGGMQPPAEGGRPETTRGRGNHRASFRGDAGNPGRQMEGVPPATGEPAADPRAGALPPPDAANPSPAVGTGTAPAQPPPPPQP